MALPITRVINYLKGFFIDEVEVDFVCDVVPTARAMLTNKAHCDANQDVTTIFGIITDIEDRYLTVNNNHVYKTAGGEDKYTVGDKVWFKIQTMPNGSRPVVGLGLLSTVDESASETWDSNTCRVKIFNGHEVHLSNSMSCSIDKVDTNFGYLPASGDLVFFETSNIGGQNVIVSLKPFLEESTEGIITKLKGSNGFIESRSGLIWFTGNVVLKSYIPLVGDRVRVTAVFSECPEASVKRAIHMTLIDNSMYVQENQNDLPFDIMVSGKFQLGIIDLKDRPLTTVINIVNRRPKAVKFCKGEFRREQFQLIADELVLPVKINPYCSISLTFKLKPEFVGHHHETYDFYFSGFRISRNFTWAVTTPHIKELNQLACSYRRPDRKLPETLTKETCTFGSLLHPKKNFRQKMEAYKVPAEMKDILVQKLKGNFIKDLVAVYPVLKETLNAENYSERFHCLLFAEEATIMIEFAKLSREHVFMKRSGQYLQLTIEGLKDQRPSLTLGDQVLVTQPWSGDTNVHLGYIHKVSLDSLFIDFSEAFQDSYKETDCNVQFRCQSSSFTKQHQAVTRAQKNHPQILFPKTKTVEIMKPLINAQHDEIGWFNRDLNTHQRNAVINALRAECRPLPYIVFGPPGTGKTSTVVEIVLQITRSSIGKILVCAPSNSAANLIARRLIYYGGLKPDELVRIFAHTRREAYLEPDLVSYAGSADSELGYHKITVGTCLSVACLHDMLNVPRFSHVVIDEAGYASEPQALVPLGFLQPNGGVILAGDPKQLGPTLCSMEAKTLGLQLSYLHRLTLIDLYAHNIEKYPETIGFNPKLITCLQLNYRSVPEILAFPNRLFYNSSLQSVMNANSGREGEIIKAFFQKRPVRDRPSSLIFHGIAGRNYQEADSPSWFNAEEIIEVNRYVIVLMSIGVRPDEIGIITPYRKQVMKIREILRDCHAIEDIKIGSVEEFQGQERQVILLSTVRSNCEYLKDDQKHCLGFLCDPARLNVSITRARSLVIVLGNPHLLSCDPHWKALITECLNLGTYIGCNPPALVLPRTPKPNNVHETEKYDEESVEEDSSSDEETCDESDPILLM